jgi:hypothetical protein
MTALQCSNKKQADTAQVAVRFIFILAKMNPKLNMALNYGKLTMKKIVTNQTMIEWAKNEAATFKIPGTAVHEPDAEKRLLTSFVCKAAVKSVRPDFVYLGRNFYSPTKKWVYVKSSLCSREPSNSYHFFWVDSEYQRERPSIDYLIFSFTNKDYNQVWLAGWLSISEFINKARKIKAGETYTRKNNQTYTNKVDVLEVCVSDLNKF